MKQIAIFACGAKMFLDPRMDCRAPVRVMSSGGYARRPIAPNGYPAECLACPCKGAARWNSVKTLYPTCQRGRRIAFGVAIECMPVRVERAERNSHENRSVGDRGAGRD